MHIMIIDDNSVNLGIFQRIAEKISPDNEVTGFLDPLAALVAALERAPDLIVVDYMMPGLNGLELVGKFRAIPGNSEIPVVMITAVGDRDLRQTALQSGITDFLTKPVDPSEVRARLTNLLALRQSHLHLKDQNAWLASEVKKATRTILEREEELIFRLARAAEYRDPETGGHIQRMARYSWLISRALGRPEEESDDLLKAAPMHDLGKMGTPDAILLKPGKLTDAEMSIMRQHAMIGFNILMGSSSRLNQLGAEVALSHHEKWDGSGYPRQLKGTEIPLSGRIVAVADVFDALTSVRPYKKAWEPDAARGFLEEQSGRHFDPDCVKTFLSRWTEALEIRTRFGESEE